MKIAAIIHNAFVIFVLCGALSAHPVPTDYTTIECTITPIKRAKTSTSHPHIPHGPKNTSNKTPSQSMNWSGYVAADNLNNPTLDSVSAVYGSWVVPTLKVTTNKANCAVWVGIDGYRSSTVEQLGTDHQFINGIQKDYVWFEMYPASSYLIKGFPVKAGDVISASVIYSGNNIFTLNIQNDTKKVSYTVPTSYTTSSKALRTSAEWIVEAPYHNGILPLANFGYIYMWGCIAQINSVSALINNDSWQNNAINMVNNASQLKDITSSILQDNGSFFVTWKQN